jgi:hypothetical protein
LLRARDVSAAHRFQGGVHPVGAAQSELDDRLAACGQHAARGLARQQCLEVAEVEHGTLDQLRFGDRRRDLEQWLVGEDRRAFGHGAHAPGEAEVAEVVEET